MASPRPLDWRRGDCDIVWAGPYNDIHLSYADPPRQALRHEHGVVVVESLRIGEPNLCCYDDAGAVVARPAFPRTRGPAMGFDQAFYEGDDLVVILVTTGGDWAFVLDPTTGEWGRSHEWR